jgi:hypothetical protein
MAVMKKSVRKKLSKYLERLVKKHGAEMTLALVTGIVSSLAADNQAKADRKAKAKKAAKADRRDKAETATKPKKGKPDKGARPEKMASPEPGAVGRKPPKPVVVVRKRAER